MRRAHEAGVEEVVVTQPGEWRLIEALEALSIPVRQVSDDRFIVPLPVFDAWAKGRKTPWMEHFDREMRRRTAAS